MKFSLKYGIFALTFLAGGQQSFLNVLSFTVQYNHCWIYPFLQKFRKWSPQFFYYRFGGEFESMYVPGFSFYRNQHFLCRIKNIIAEAYLKIQITELGTKIALTFNG